MGLFVAGERTLETLVLERLSRRSGNVVGPFWLAFLSSFHLDLNPRFLKRKIKHIAVGELDVVWVFFKILFSLKLLGDVAIKHIRKTCESLQLLHQILAELTVKH